MKKYYVVLSPNGKEGFITQDRDDAEFAATGLSGPCLGVSCVAQAFRDVYFEEPDDEGEAEADEAAIFGSAIEPEVIEIDLP